MERLEIKMIRSLTLIIVAAMFFLVGCATAPIEEEVATTAPVEEEEAEEEAEVEEEG